MTNKEKFEAGQEFEFNGFGLVYDNNVIMSGDTVMASNVVVDSGKMTADIAGMGSSIIEFKDMIFS